MGRLRRERRKLHSEASRSEVRIKSDQKRENESEVNPNGTGNGFQWHYKHLQPRTKMESCVHNYDSQFSGLNISFDDLNVSAEDPDKNNLCRKNRMSRNLRIKMRRKNCLAKKVDLLKYLVEKKSQRVEEKPSKVLPWNMEPLFNALPSFEDLDKVKKKMIKTKIGKERSTQKARIRQRDWLAEIEAFKSTLQNPGVKSNPLEMTEIVGKNIGMEKPYETYLFNNAV